MRTRSPTRHRETREDAEIYVGNINAQTPVEADDLKRLFSIAGQVTNVRIEKSNSKDTHFAFITFSTIEESEQGCLYDGFKYHALSLKVQRKGRPGPPKLAQPPSDTFTQRLRELQEQENTDLYLTNLNTADASEEMLHEAFSMFGDVRRVCGAGWGGRGEELGERKILWVEGGGKIIGERGKKIHTKNRCTSTVTRATLPAQRSSRSLDQSRYVMVLFCSVVVDFYRG